MLDIGYWIIHSGKLILDAGYWILEKIYELRYYVYISIFFQLA